MKPTNTLKREGVTDTLSSVHGHIRNNSLRLQGRTICRFLEDLKMKKAQGL